MHQLKVEEAISETTYHNGCIELINYSLTDTDLSLYLQYWESEELEVIKFVKTSMNDQQLNELLNFVHQNSVHTLVLSGNNLTEVCLDAFLNYLRVDNGLKNVYLSKNNINTLRGNTREKINLLRSKGINLYI